MRERTLKSGETTYQVLFREGTKQRSRSFDNAKDAEKFADKVRVLGAKKALADEVPKVEGITLDELAERYWEYCAGRVRSDRTVADYRRDYRNWISPHLGHKVAATIDEADVQNWIDTIRRMAKTDEEGNLTPRLSAKSVADRHAILHGIYKYASAPTRQIVPQGHNPAIGTELPKRRKKLPVGFRPAEWQAFHGALSKIDADAADLAEFLLASASRFSEAIALDTHSFEDDGVNIWVTIDKVARRSANGAVSIVADTKTESSQRRFKLDRGASTMVRKRIANTKPGGLVFATSGGSLWNYSHFYARFWKKAMKNAGISRSLSPHMLRHTGVGYMLLSGRVSQAEIQRRVGHSSIQTTINVYGGMVEDVNDDALDFLEAMRSTAPKAVKGERDGELDQ